MRYTPFLHEALQLLHYVRIEDLIFNSRYLIIILDSLMYMNQELRLGFELTFVNYTNVDVS